MPFNMDQHLGSVSGSGSSCLMAKVSYHLFCFNSSVLINGDNHAQLLYRRFLGLFGKSFEIFDERYEVYARALMIRIN